MECLDEEDDGAESRRAGLPQREALRTERPVRGNPSERWRSRRKREGRSNEPRDPGRLFGLKRDLGRRQCDVGAVAAVGIRESARGAVVRARIRMRRQAAGARLSRRSRFDREISVGGDTNGQTEPWERTAHEAHRNEEPVKDRRRRVPVSHARSMLRHFDRRTQGRRWRKPAPRTHVHGSNRFRNTSRNELRLR